MVGGVMTFDNLLATLKKLGISLELKVDQIGVPKGILTPELRQAIIAHKPELIERLQAESIPVAVPTAIERKRPSPIRLQYANNW